MNSDVEGAHSAEYESWLLLEDVAPAALEAPAAPAALLE